MQQLKSPITAISLPFCVAPSNISQILSITTRLAPGKVINWVVGRPGNEANAYEHITHTFVCGCVCLFFFFFFLHDIQIGPALVGLLSSL